MKNKKKYEFYAIIGIIIIGILFRLILFFKNDVINYDGVYYTNIAKNLFSGNGYVIEYLEWFGVKTDIPYKTFEYTPIYPILIGIQYIIFQDWFTAGKAASLLSGILFMITSFFVSRIVFSKKIANAVLLLTSTSFTLILYSTEINTGLTYGIFILIGFLFFTLGERENKTKFFIYSAAFLSLGFYTRFQAILIPIYFIISFILLKDNRKKWKNLFIFLIIFYLLITPWLIAISSNENGVFKEKIKTMVYYSQTERTDETMINQIDSFKAIDTYYENTPKIDVIKYFLLHNIINIYTIILYLSPIIGILLILGSLYSLKHWRNNILSYGLIFFHISLPTHYTEMIRHLMPVLPLFFAVGVVGLIDIVKIIKNLNIRKILIKSCIVLSIISIALSTYYFIDEYNHLYDKDPNHELIASKLIDNNITNQTIASLHSHHSFYSENRWIMVPYENYTRTINFLKEYNAKILILEQETVSVHPELLELVNNPDSEKFNQTTLLYQRDQPYRIAIFRVI